MEIGIHKNYSVYVLGQKLNDSKCSNVRTAAI